MSSNHVILESQLCFNQFDGVESHFSTILSLVIKARFVKALSANTRVYSKLVEEFYMNDSCKDGEIYTKVVDITTTLEPREVEISLSFVNDGDNGFGIIDTKKGLDFIISRKRTQKPKATRRKISHRTSSSLLILWENELSTKTQPMTPSVIYNFKL